MLTRYGVISRCTWGYGMRTLGFGFVSDLTAGVRGLLTSKSRGVAAALLGVAAVVPMLHGQTAVQAPYLLPYTLSTYAGANPQYTTFGVACTGGYVQNASGDGCIATKTSINGEPHDVRVDGRGNVFYIDNTSTASGVIHKIIPYDTLSTIYIGNATSCYTSSGVSTTYQTKYGDTCQATDGLANNSGIKTTPTLKPRGLSINGNGDLAIADYGDYVVHDVMAATGIMKLLAGTGASPGGNTDGPVKTSTVIQPRGVGFDPTGNIAYLADTGNNTLRSITALSGIPTTTTLTAANPAANVVKRVDNNVSMGSALLSGPEDAQTDSFGNIYIADFGNSVIRAVYKGGNLPWFPHPVSRR